MILQCRDLLHLVSVLSANVQCLRYCCSRVSSHWSRYEPPITQEQYEHCVDELLGTPVDVLCFCLGDGRTMLHDTQVGELWGANVEDGSHPAIGDGGWDHAIFRRAHQNAAHLISQNLDPLRVVVNCAHTHGMQLYPCLLVQTPPDAGVRCSTWHQLHADEYAIGSQPGQLPPEYPEQGRRCFDFSIDAVREERLALIREVIQNYEIDGFELQMNYVPYYFHPARMAEGVTIMTKWISEIRELLRSARGPDAELIVRVPGLPHCEAQGLDVREWCVEGLVDVLIAENADGNRCDPNYDWRPMVSVASGTNTRVIASVYSYLNSDRLDQAPLPMIRAAACNAWAQAVDGIYVNQWYHMWPFDGSFYEKLREIAFPHLMAPKDKSVRQIEFIACTCTMLFTDLWCKYLSNWVELLRCTALRWPLVVLRADGNGRSAGEEGVRPGGFARASLRTATGGAETGDHGRSRTILRPRPSAFSSSAVSSERRDRVGSLGV